MHKKGTQEAATNANWNNISKCFSCGSNLRNSIHYWTTSASCISTEIQKGTEDYPRTIADPLREILDLVQNIPDIWYNILAITLHNCIPRGTKSYMKHWPILSAVYLTRSTPTSDSMSIQPYCQKYTNTNIKLSKHQ